MNYIGPDCARWLRKAVSATNAYCKKHIGVFVVNAIFWTIWTHAGWAAMVGGAILGFMGYWGMVFLAMLYNGWKLIAEERSMHENEPPSLQESLAEARRQALGRSQ